jgi:hypothetical protein
LLLGRSSYHLSHVPSPFCFSYFFLLGSYFMPRPAWHLILLFMLPWVAVGMTGVSPTPSAYWLRWGLQNIFALLASNCHLANLCLPTRKYYRLEPPMPTLFLYFLFKNNLVPNFMSAL